MLGLPVSLLLATNLQHAQVGGEQVADSAVALVGLVTASVLAAALLGSVIDRILASRRRRAAAARDLMHKMSVYRAAAPYLDDHGRICAEYQADLAPTRAHH